MSESVSGSRTPLDVGMVLVRPVRDLQTETFSQELLAGLGESLGRFGGTILVKVVADEDAELATYRQWGEAGRITSVLIEDLTIDDTRLALLDELGIEATVSGDLDLAGNRPAIWTDHAGAMRRAMVSLHGLGHRVIGRVAGPRRFRHSVARSVAFFEVSAELGISPSEETGDYSRQSGAAAVRTLMAMERPPTAIIFDNDLMALGGLHGAEEAGKQVPEDLSLIAWDDSVRCQMSTPPLAALSHDVRQIGEMLGAAIHSGRLGDIVQAQTPPPTLVMRESVKALID